MPTPPHHYSMTSDNKCKCKPGRLSHVSGINTPLAPGAALT